MPLDEDTLLVFLDFVDKWEKKSDIAGNARAIPQKLSSNIYSEFRALLDEHNVVDQGIIDTFKWHDDKMRCSCWKTLKKVLLAEAERQLKNAANLP